MVSYLRESLKFDIVVPTKGVGLINKYFAHFKTITKHKYLVFLACCGAGIPWQGILHDLSKYSPSEFFSSARYYQGNRSPIDAEKEEKGYSLAWLHHKGRNRHHYEYWIDYLDDGGRPLIIPYRFVLEMVCDWIGAGKVYGGRRAWNPSKPLQFWQWKSQRARIHPATAQLLDYLLVGFESGSYSFLRRRREHERRYEEIIEKHRAAEAAEIVKSSEFIN